MSFVLCVYMLATPMKHGQVWKEYPMLKGVEIKREGDFSYVDFSVGLSKIKYNKKWNNVVQWTRTNNCVSDN